MNLPIGQLIQGASQARNAFVGGQQERQQSDLANALMARKLEREQQEQSLRDALTRGQIEHQSAQTALLKQPQDKWEKVESDDGIYEWNPRTHETRRMMAPSAPSSASLSVSPVTGNVDVSEDGPQTMPEVGSPQQGASSLPVGRLTQPQHGLQPKRPVPAPRGPVAQQHIVDPVSGKVTFYDPTNPPANLSVTPRPKQENPAAEMRRQNLINSVRGQFNSDQSFKDAQQVQSAFAKIKSAASGPHTATNDMSLIFGIMKLQDPNSTVREGEYASAKNAANWPARARDLYNLALRNHILPDETRQQFLETAQQIAQAQRTAFGSTMKRYSDIATRQGIDPRDVVVDPYEGLFDDAATPAAKGGGDPEAAWAKTNPPKKGESFEAYHQRYLKSKGGR